MLEVKNLSLSFETNQGSLNVIDQLTFSISKGETLGVVGESGCGKSVTSLALMKLLPNSAKILSGEINLFGKNLLLLSEKEMQKIRGRQLSMIFQDPMTSLNPCYTVGFQIQEMLNLHNKLNSNELKNRCLELLNNVGISDPEHRFKQYPHELSGGMSQRVMIAMAIACSPNLLIADEPTTALDVTIQAQILDLLTRLKKNNQMGLMLITHNIGVVAQYANRIMVMYAGQIVEIGPKEQVIHSPKHPYTQALLESLPGDEGGFRTRLPALKGMVPDLLNRPTGCQFHPRCPYVEDKCLKSTIPLYDSMDTKVRCVRYMYL